MKFVDEVRIQLKAGDGGNGAVAFRREKFVDKGGPSGGDGGNGGSIIFAVDGQLTTLLDFRYQSHHAAQRGGHGMGSDMNGKGGDDLVLRVPLGTLVKDEASGELLADLSQPEQRFVVAKGGRGGLGNMNFATSTRQAPRFAQDGTPGEEKTLILELKLLADVGLLGFPNAGKSTLVSRISRARPKIADYPFTTLVPNLGVVQYKDRLSFVVADIPGLIEGAAEGVGLGHQFLRHVERCRALIHLVDLSAGLEGRDPVADFDAINRELLKYSPELGQKPQIVVANKVDLPDAQAALPAFREALGRRGIPVQEMSGATGDGVQAALDGVARILFSHPSARHEPAPLVTAESALASLGPKKRAKGADVAGKQGSEKGRGGIAARAGSARATKKVAAARAGSAAASKQKAAKRSGSAVASKQKARASAPAAAARKPSRSAVKRSGKSRAKASAARSSKAVRTRASTTRSPSRAARKPSRKAR